MNSKNLSNSFSTGGGGAHFEAHVQSSFVVLMLSGGYAPCLPCWPIVEIKLQGKVDGFDTDDLVVFVEEKGTENRRKLLCQVKHSIAITKGKSNSQLSEVIQAAWDDFNNPDIFTRGKDNIALITGPLNRTDFHNAQWLLDQARHTKNADEFYRNVKQAKFSPSKSEEKLEVFQYHLKAANNGSDVSSDELYAFLNHFHLLGYDLGKEVGVVLSLLHSHISQFNQQYPHWIWSRVVDVVQTWNQDAGTISPENLPEELIEAFKQPTFIHIPTELTKSESETDWNQNQHAAYLALANLVGAWNEKNESDVSVINKVTTEDDSNWIPKARDILQLPDSPLSLRNGIWKMTKRANLWDALGSRIFDQNLDDFKESAVFVLTERHPYFELPLEERYMASIHRKKLTHSTALRKGMANGLAILGNRSDALINCSQGKAETTAVLTIREILEDADWVLWGSLNDLLPVLAEAAPNEFLKTVEKALHLSPCPFDELFYQEGSGIGGSNYLTGLLWALEGLAWDEEYLVRVCVILGELASHDPGGTWANRPINSLSTILLPWLPQTLASIEKRKAAVRTLFKEWPEIAWKLILSLLPNQHQVSSGSYKPSWRNTIPEDCEKSVTRQEYYEQVLFYAELAVSMANHETVKLSELVDHFGNLPKPSFDKLIEVLSSDDISGLPEDERLPIWDKLTEFTSIHRKFADAKWALDAESLSSIEEVSDKLAPSNPLNLYQHLFSRRAFDLYEENGNWEEQQKKLDEYRQEAVEDIFNGGGTDSVIQFAGAVESPDQVGCSLGIISGTEIDSVLLPECFDSEDQQHLSFIAGYVGCRHYVNGWTWADDLDKSDWTTVQLGQFLSYLPFTRETWDRAAEWLGDVEGDFWLITSANPYQQKDNELGIAIDKLIEHGRPYAAIRCLYRMHHEKHPIDVSQCVSALLAAVSSSETPNMMDQYQIVELIKYLQQNPEVLKDGLFQVEWAYLQVLQYHRDASPILLERRLASDPEFFCEIIQLIYRPDNSEGTTSELSEEKKALATNALYLLHDWRTLPGMQRDSSFDGEKFSNWLQRVKEMCMESGHLDIALIYVGGVLIHSPPDANGLWINHTIAEALNESDAESMRNGFSVELYNSRGAHVVDPTGKPERELAEKYRKQAEAVENAGYQRLAVTLRELADSYDKEATRNKEWRETEEN
ncbi:MULTISPECIES: hypothetical protein [Methanohalophilus]|uniref:Uncharacterized protein n=1 Tax=Methanohalophilus euhalobius TaxID=51203 RepID=A0A314ZRF6_9EURY|nr:MULTISPECIES: hypothetical protein [Methanohalophilus]OBZ35091.1 MAG: hypothetical protein A9957_00740 [Methanohalophilus sp. DAL1]PQV42368.1 hypothetical protein B0H22_10611 [Methanohalophilus euhalobius]RNI08124.1 hypothetical protein EDD83_06675 [Methanohalophilus euhalobius]